MWGVNMWVNVWVIVLIFFLDAVACLLMTYSSGNDLLRYFSDSLIDTLVGWCI